MRNFLFENLCLISQRDKKARMITFHPKKNLIVGRNHTGKSSIIKTIFLTLGANPKGKLEKWDQTTVTYLTISVDKTTYKVLYKDGLRALFDSSDKLIMASSTRTEWVAAINNVLGFNLILTDKNSEPLHADTRAFFLPFYINQDGSWQSSWDTFTSLLQYNSPVQSILDYFSGIKPPQYYFLNSQRQIEQKKLSDLNKEFSFLNKAKERFSRSVSLNEVKITALNFTEEIQQLSEEVAELNAKQEHLREKFVRENEIIENIELQINLAKDALKSYEKDIAYLENNTSSDLVCPVCNTVHQDNFLPTLTYAEDARVLQQLIIQLSEDRIKVKGSHGDTERELNSLRSNYSRVSEILQARRDGVRFEDVVKSLGAETAFEAFISEEKVLGDEIRMLEQSVTELEERLKKLTDKKISSEVLKTYRTAYAVALNKLDLPAIKTSTLKLGSRPALSGSGGPRSILAYYSALWSVCFGKYGSFKIPIVIDSPNQQGQDHINLPKVLSYVANDLPDTQIILSSEVDIAEKFDKEIRLSEQYSVLQEGPFELLNVIVEPLLKEMYKELDTKATEAS